MATPDRWSLLAGTDQKVTFAASSVQSAAVGNYTYAVILSTTATCHIAVGVNPTATATTYLLKATDPSLILGIKPGEKVAAIQDTAGGSLFMTELTA